MSARHRAGGHCGNAGLVTVRPGLWPRRMAASRKKPATKIAGATGGEMNRNGTSGYQPRSCRVEETWLSRNPLPSTPVQNQDHVFGGAVKYVSVLLTPY